MDISSLNTINVNTFKANHIFVKSVLSVAKLNKDGEREDTTWLLTCKWFLLCMCSLVNL